MKNYLTFLLFLFGVQLSFGQVYNSADNKKLNVIIGNIGQGDAILIRCPHGTHEILIDAEGLQASSYD